MELNEMIAYIKKEFPKDSIEIKECLSLLSETIDSTITDIKKASDNAYENRSWEKAEKLLQMAKSINEVENSIYKHIEDLELEDSVEEKVVVQQENEQLEDNKLPNYSDYAVDENIPHKLLESFTYKCPAAFSIFGTKIKARQWKDVLLSTCEIFAKKDPEKFLEIAADKTMQGRKIDYFSTKTDKIRKPVKLKAVNIYVGTNLSSNQIRETILKILKKYNVGIEDYNIFLRADYTALHE